MSFRVDSNTPTIVPQGFKRLEKPLFTLDEVLQRENYILCDYSISNPVETDWYADHIYGVNRFSELELHPIEMQRDFMRFFAELLGSSKTLVSRGIPLEIQTMVNLLEGKKNFLLMRDHGGERGRERRFSEEKRNSVEREIFEEICDLFYKSYNQASRKVFSTKNEQIYTFLERLVLSVSEHTEAKTDLRGFYNPERRPKRTKDFHTDEQTIAISIYLSVFENQKGCVLGRDSDLRRILFNTMSFLSIPNRREYREIVDSCKINRINVYYCEQPDKADLDFDSSQFGSHGHKNISQETLRKIEADVRPYNPFLI